MDFNKGAHFKEWITSKINWFITLIIATTLSITVVNIQNVVFKFETLFAILIIASFCLLFIYSFDFYKDYNRIMQSEKVPMDAIIKVEKKRVIFDDVTFSDKKSEVKIYRKLYNNMTVYNEVYDRYKIMIKSSQDVPHLEEITFTKDKKIIELRDIPEDITNPMRCVEIDCKKLNGCEINIEDPVRKNVEFFVPLHLKAGKTCDFEISYRTKAYEKARIGQIDFTQMQINRITNHLQIEMNLTGEMKEKYKLSPCYEKDGTRLSHKIFDASSERMRRTESQLKEQPIYDDDNAIWKIENPKIGYSYRMYFKLILKNQYN